MIATLLKYTIGFILALCLFVPLGSAPTEFDNHRVTNDLDHVELLKQVSCLARAIYFESANESLTGQQAVARVVINRVSHRFGQNPCAVVYQRSIVKRLVNNDQVRVVVCQFSWTCKSKIPNIESIQYKTAMDIAYEVLQNNAYKDVIPANVLFFHSVDINPNWSYNRVTQIGNHVFYRK